MEEKSDKKDSKIHIETKHFYRFVKIYSVENKEAYFIFVTKSKDIFWWTTNQKIENLEKQKILTQPKNPDA